MGIHIREHFENYMDVTDRSEPIGRIDKISDCYEDDTDSFEQKCDDYENNMWNTTANISVDDGQICEDRIQTKKYRPSNLFFGSIAEVNLAYGEGGANQYFIKDAFELKEKGNLTIVSREEVALNTDDMRKCIMQKNVDGITYWVHKDDRVMNMVELEQLSQSTREEPYKQNKEKNVFSFTDEELKDLEENTPDTECLNNIVEQEGGEPDYRHPLGNQEDSEGIYFPDAWSNSLELKDGDCFYQLLPHFSDGHESKSSYFTDKETVDQCRDVDHHIDLALLMSKLQKKPNEEWIDKEKSMEMIKRYEIIQYIYHEDYDTGRNDDHKGDEK